jgi:serine/threonine-protein kinase
MHQVKDLINEQYEVRQRLFGGMACVYIVFDQVAERMLAIKTLREELLESPEAAARFEREARTWINLGVHENIVHALAFQRRPQPQLFLEYIDGLSLQKLLRAEPGGLAVRQVVRFARHLSLGLDYAHTRPMPGGRQGIVHRDLKPGNVMITRGAVAKLTDFGLALAQADSQLTSSHLTLGTLPYMPPEQWENAHAVTERADLFALGAVLYEMLTGVRAFPAQTAPELMFQIYNVVPAPIATYRRDAPAALAELIMDCLKKAPRERPASASAVLERLDAIEASLPPDASPGLVCPGCGYAPHKVRSECPVCGVSLASEPERRDDPMWTCRCGRLAPRRYRYCIHCGQDSTTLGHCPACGEMNAPQYRFCTRCGAAITPRA